MADPLPCKTNLYVPAHPDWFSFSRNELVSPPDWPLPRYENKKKLK